MKRQRTLAMPCLMVGWAVTVSHADFAVAASAPGEAKFYVSPRGSDTGSGIMIWQSGGNRVDNNLIHHLPYSGMIIREGPLTDAVIQRNIFYSAGKETVFIDELPPGNKRSTEDRSGRALARARDAHTDYNMGFVPFDKSSVGCRFLPKDHYPAFSWDTIPLYMHVRKGTSFTQEELNYLAGFPLITLEKTTGSSTYGSSEEGTREAAKSIKAVNPAARVLYYRNVMCNYGTYKVNEGLKDIPGAFLRARDGNTRLHRGVREVYDLANPALRTWWVDHCVDMARHDEIDGLFLDGNIKALDPAFLAAEIGAKKKQEVAAGYAAMMQDLEHRMPSDKLLVANIIRARLPHSGLDWLTYFDGSYLEGIETPADGLTRLEYLGKGIAAIQQAAREGKIICMSMGLGKAAPRGLGIDDSRQRLARGAKTQPRLEYCLALFLICAEKYSYVYPHDGYDVNNHRSSIWLKRFAEYDKPLGPPKGPATQKGYTYTREFEYASVYLDIEREEARITWKLRP